MEERRKRVRGAGDGGKHIDPQHLRTYEEASTSLTTHRAKLDTLVKEMDQAAADSEERRNRDKPAE